MHDQIELSLASRITTAPISGPSGPGADRLATLVAEAADRYPALSEAIRNPNVSALLRGTFEGSLYLTTLATRDLARLERVLTQSPERLFAELSDNLTAAMASAPDFASAKHALRLYKTEVALLSALADLADVWPVMTVTRTLSECADLTVKTSVRFLFRLAAEKGLWRPTDPATPEHASGYFVLAMGKLGAFELNYSSDIDLMVFFDRDRSRLAGDGDLQSFFVRLTRDLVLLLEERTEDGYVFRTDLRLRPDAGATQIALSTVAAHGYYETVGQNWERAAMIKARAIAGDIEAGETFLSELAPFVWRKYLDFAAIADVHAMKRQIHAHREIGGIKVRGQNVKLGRGGIREIEFFVQTQQLIAGGRQTDLRVRATFDALDALDRRGWVKPDVHTELAEAYRYLRGIEHRLQMIADEQTHEIPEATDAIEAFARFAGYADEAALAAALVAQLETVETHYAGLFEDAPTLTGEASNMVFAGATDDPQTLEELRRIGYSQPAQVLAIVRGWHHGRTPSVRSPRARERLTEVQPLLIQALADTVDPDAAIAGFDRFLSNLPSGVQLFSLLKAQPSLIRLIADIMGSAPRLAQSLAKRRRLLDAVLDPQAVGSRVDGDAIDDLLRKAFNAARAGSENDPMQEILDTARVIGSEQRFLVGVGILTGSVSAAEAGVAYATVAERLIASLLREVTREMEDAHGRVPGGSAVVVGMGKLGGRELAAASDVDLILIYDFEDGASQSDGEKPLAPSHYYTRLTQRLINAISAHTAEGALYEVDMRLRPSGQKGPVATRLSSFISYQANEAWTWEHMALTRARVVGGPASLAGRVDDAIRNVLATPRDRRLIAADIHDMRRRIEAEKGTSDIWDLKQVRGGLVDIEFIVQHLQLIHAAEHPAILDQNTLAALAAAASEGIISTEDHQRLATAGQLLHDLTQILRLTLAGSFDPASAPKGLKLLLTRASGDATFAELETRLKAAQATILEAFDRLIV
ncbi:bifunctional [glutamine synthetase] adenylyltransferase/[glutamine synthetase]-adenylyl-L-tyrosine phosphorylase [Hyphomicrobium methylovorum]|uniref:bifunctional [glutamine synthetase] adenylyltransferase/[glutamine synthetase]-adenylyl-L-tyrosine phosphorylase n=1 Tax=Hyphomicrobium methylovorum TaxID=84 RepID=UPI001FE689A4|nr:bifunctional [glutamine synthetase] adenylyltransferase/[glutamine synthetase]-adenylyl-L-tyrosine phosphorylase [Hyphomicrobium methylovorum]